VVEKLQIDLLTSTYFAALINPAPYKICTLPVLILLPKPQTILCALHAIVAWKKIPV
jgi:hypothetical protein